MCVACVSSPIGSDLRCAVCGQGFLLFAPRLTRGARDSLRQLVQEVLRAHHEGSRDGHPKEAFSVDFAEAPPALEPGPAGQAISELSQLAAQEGSR